MNGDAPIECCVVVAVVLDASRCSGGFAAAFSGVRGWRLVAKNNKRQLTINRQQPQHRGGQIATVFGQRRVKLAAMAFTLLWQTAALLCRCNAVTVPWHGSSVATVTMWQRLSLQGATAIEKVNEND